MIINVKTDSQTQFIDITADIQQAVQDSKVIDGWCLIYVPHTTAAVTINENADPTVKADVLTVLNSIVPEDMDYRHMEGNSPAHVKSTLVGVSETIAIENKRLVLGIWQGIFLCEFDGPRPRKVYLQIFKA
jgi:secondary thiamine-phosphate synthase enzyme